MLKRLVTFVAVLCCALALPSTRSADAASRRDKLLRLLNARPKTMTVDKWREQRREAARELGRLRERRAVPTLLRIIAKERFDVILEIAIDALGNIGDRRAREPLRKLLRDPSLDSYVRDAAAGALKKLRGGSGGTGRVKGGRGKGGRGKGGRGKGGSGKGRGKGGRGKGSGKGGSSAGGADGFGELVKLSLPSFDADDIARVNQLDIVAGNGGVFWDGASDVATMSFALSTRYLLQVERRLVGYSIDAAADFAFGYANPPGEDASWTLAHNLRVHPEVRAYPFTNVPKLFGQLSAGVGYGMTLAETPSAPDKRFNFNTTLSIGGGPGYGRIIDVGQRLRLRRVARALRQSGLLSGKIAPDIASKILAAWYALRNSYANFQQLGHTLRILRAAGLLAKDSVDPAATYRIIRVLDDPQLVNRREGLMVRAGYGYARTLRKDADDTQMGFAYLTGELSSQIGTTRAFGAMMRFFFDHLGEPNTYGVDVAVRFDQYLYNRAFDPLGSLGVEGRFTLNNQPGSSFEDGGVAWRLAGGASYTRWFNRGSLLRVSALGGVAGNAPFLMITFEARYGLARGSFVAAR